MGLLDGLFGGADAQRPLAAGTLSDRMSGPVAQIGLAMLAASGGPKVGLGQPIAAGLANSVATQKKNATLAYLRQNNPDIAQMVDAGLDVGDAFTLSMRQRAEAQEQARWQANQDFLSRKFDYEREQDAANGSLDRRYKQAQIDALGQKEAGYRTLSANEASQMGLPSGQAYQIGPNNKIDPIGGNGQAQNPGIEAGQRADLARQYGIDPASAEGQRFILTGTLPASDKGVTAGDRQAIRDADDMVQGGEATLGLLDRAMDLSGKAYDGFGAGARAAVSSQFGSEGGLATREYDNIVTEQALGQLRQVFGGNPTEGERAILLDIQGSSSQPQAVRDAILKRAKAAVQRRVEFNRDRASELRGGTYYNPRTNQTSPAPGGVDPASAQPAPAGGGMRSKYGLD